MESNKVWVWAVVILVVLGGAWLVFKGNAAPSETGPIKIGVSMPLSGEAASYGEAGRAGLQLALKEINDSGGVNGRPIELIYEDDKCDSTGASVFQKLTSIDQVTAIIGPVCSAAAGPGLPIARTAGTPTLLIGASAPGLAGGDDSIFSDYASDSLQGKFVAEYVYNKLGKKKVAVLYVKNDWGQGLQQVFSDRFKELGGTIVFNEGAAQDATDVKSLLIKIKAAQPDLIYLPAYPALAVVTLRQMKDLGIKIPVMGGDALVGKEFLTSGVADGVMYVTGAVGNPDAFQAKVKAVSGSNAVINIITPLGYDALKILAQVIGEKGTGAKAIISGLKSLNYTVGVSFPVISYDQNGDLSKATYDVSIVKGTTPEIVAQ